MSSSEEGSNRNCVAPLEPQDRGLAVRHGSHKGGDHGPVDSPGDNVVLVAAGFAGHGDWRGRCPLSGGAGLGEVVVRHVSCRRVQGRWRWRCSLSLLGGLFGGRRGRRILRVGRGWRRGRRLALLGALFGAFLAPVRLAAFADDLVPTAATTTGAAVAAIGSRPTRPATTSEKRASCHTAIAESGCGNSGEKMACEHEATG